jgi:hypothetical protein
MAEGTPSRRLPAIDLNEASAQKLVEDAQLERELAELIVAGRPYAVPEDLLRRPELHKPAWAPSVVKLLLDGRTAGTDAMATPSTAVVLRFHHTGVVVGVERSKPSRVFLAHPLGLELASAALDENGKLDLPTFRLCGWPPAALAHLPLDGREQARALLRGPAALWAGSLFQDEESLDLPSAEETAPRELSKHLRSIQVFGRRALFDETVGLGAHGDPPYNFLTNGCTGVPDFDIKYCCDEHDLCYARTPLGFRWGCDLELARCIAAHGGPEHWVLGVLYGLGVLVLGGPFALPWPGLVTGGDAPAHVHVPTSASPCKGSGPCKYRFHFIGVHNDGPDPFTSDGKYRFSFSSGPSAPKKYTSPPIHVAVGHDAESMPVGDIVSDYASGGNCGDMVGPVTLYVEEPDLGFGKQFTIGPFRCCNDPAPADIELDLAIVDGMLIKNTTVFHLKVRIETVCG